MRPQIVGSALLSAARFSSATSTCSRAVTVAPKILGNICPAASQSRFLSNSTSKGYALVKPQERTTTSDHNIHIKTPTAGSAPIAMASATPIHANAVLDLLKNRRTYYQLNKDLGVCGPARVDEIVQECLLHVPSSFNSQSNRVVILYGADHDKLWDITSDILRPYVAPENWSGTEARMAGFKAAAGTILFFDDQTTIYEYQEKYDLYKDKFPTWASQSNAMLQYAVWTALEAEGLGANLQHYNPLIDMRVEGEWNVPNTWQLNAQVVFGGRVGEPGPKDFKAVEERFKSFGA